MKHWNIQSGSYTMPIAQQSTINFLPIQGFTGPTAPPTITLNTSGGVYAPTINTTWPNIIWPASSNDIPKIREWLNISSKEFLEEVKQYCTDVLLKDKLPQKEQIIIPKNSSVTPIIIRRNEDPEGYEWLVDVPKQSIQDWIGVPNEVAYKLPLKHKFLNSGLLPKDAILIKFDIPVLRPFSCDLTEGFFSWFVGFCVDGEYIKNSK